MKATFMIALLVLCLPLSALDYFPTKAWKTKTLEEAGFNKEKFQKVLDYVWEDNGEHKSDAFLVIKDGYVVYEGYDRGYGPEKKHMFWSFSKSLTSTLIGIAIKKGILSLDSYAKDYYPEFDRKYGRDLQLKHVLNMSSGFRFYEENPVNIILSDVIYLYYSKKNYKNVVLNLAKSKMKNPPGYQFNYGTHQPALAMGILKRAMNNREAYNNFPWVELFDKLGMNSVVFEQDMSGTFLGGSGGWGTIKDYAKLGLLMINNGKWEGEQILPVWWNEFATKTVAPALYRPKKERFQRRLNRESYGAYWWLNKKLPMNKHRPYPHAPSDLYQAMGFRGQTMGVIPSLNLIVVRMGSDGRKKHKKMNRDKLYKLLLGSMNKEARQ